MKTEDMIIFTNEQLGNLLDEKRTAQFNDPIFVESEIKALNFIIKFLKSALKVYSLSNMSQGDINFVKNQIKIQKKRLKKRKKQLEQLNPSRLKCIQKTPEFLDVYTYTVYTLLNLIKQRYSNG